VKKRADIMLIEKGLCDSRAQAQRLIGAGQVRIGADHVIRKPSSLVEDNADLRVTQSSRYVSRGAYKLKAALDALQPDLERAVALDIGASTGGFTDLLLQAGVVRVYAVDVGYGQLHYRLRKDNRVVNLERTDARRLSPELVPEQIDVLAADVSFISLRLVLPPCTRFLKPDAWAFVLVKPQFEAGKEEVEKGGVVRDPAVRTRCVDSICQFAETNLAWNRIGVVPAPITGPAGNQEYIAAFRTGANR